jgi:hypothetical protein
MVKSIEHIYLIFIGEVPDNGDTDNIDNENSNKFEKVFKKSKKKMFIDILLKFYID